MLVTIERSKIDSQPLYGITVAESNLLICLQREVDFEFDGYVFIRKRDITDRIEGTESQKYHERLMRKEGLWQAPSRFAKNLPLGNWHELLLSLTGKPVLIANERKGDCWIGILKSSTTATTTMHCFDAMGFFDETSVPIPLRSITSVQFGDRYTSIHFKHLKTMS